MTVQLLDPPKGPVPPQVRCGGILALVNLWDAERIEIVVDMSPRHCKDPLFLVRLRGALGHELARGASQEALAGKSCPFMPVCAYDVFHNVHCGTGLDQLSRPFFMTADPLQDHVYITLTLFGCATGWSETFAQALRGAVQERGITGFGKDKLAGPVRASALLPTKPPEPRPLQAIEASFDTPVILRKGQTNAFSTTSFAGSVVNRVNDIAHWHGMHLIHSTELLQELKECSVAGLRAVDASPGRNRVHDPLMGSLGSLAFQSPSVELQQFLMVAALTGVGSKTSKGFGRFKLHAWER